MRSQGDIHPSILALGRKYTSGEVTGATARAVAMLMAFKQVVMDYYTPPDKVCCSEGLAALRACRRPVPFVIGGAAVRV